MSSTDQPVQQDAERQEKLRRFHANKIVPAAESLHRRGVQFFDREATLGVLTWYEAPPKGPDIVSVEASDCGDALARMWQEQGFDELVRLAPELQAMAEEMEQEEDPSGDVSPFLYMMY